MGRVPCRLAKSQMCGGRMRQYARQSWSSRGGERDVAVLGALALDDVDGHAVGIEIGDLEGDDLADAEAGRVGRGEQETMPGMRAGTEEPPDLLAAEDVGQLLGLLGRRDVEIHRRAAEGDVIEEAEGVSGLATRAPRELALLNQVREIGLDFLITQLVRRAVVELRELHHGGDVRLVGAG